ncbi:MAG: NUDIX domain-containing protein [Chthoniobacteraceae bacterium]|nr:NUDIX domain-containing protein [Chthoniobacteraceae bacterium]
MMGLKMAAPLSSPRYRLNAAGILQRTDGRILVCERLREAGCWQFAQGGLNQGETEEEALVREMEEELSLRRDDYVVITSKGPYRYLFGKGRKKKGFDGQQQTYFLTLMTCLETRINVATAHPEFQRTRWIRPGEFDLCWLPEFKRAVYRAVLFDFFGVEK